ncbi:MAG: diacylglycerol kinase family lipid kinase, partial [Bacteroidales bacterium]|nr:diacylglycerol kinase family lipid kinase [Bacteroidales bacterium]
MSAVSNHDKWFVVVNPHAGSGKTIAAWHKAENVLRREGVGYVYVKTEYKRHAVELVIKAARRGYRFFAAVGGDGTAHEVLNGIMKYSESEGVPSSEFTMAVIPIGSGNDWIKTHKIPHDAEAVALLMKGRRVVCQDIVRVTRHDPEDISGEPLRVDYMLNVGGVGFDARVCERVNAAKDMGRSGKLLYINALLKVLANFYDFPVRVIVDGEEVFKGDCYSMAFGVGMYSGSGMRQVPMAVVDDGLVDVTIIPKMPILTLLPKLPRLFNGTLWDVPQIIGRKAKKVQVLPVSDITDPAEVDGEVIKDFPVTPVRTNILKLFSRV